jgi:Tfp pilus assembly protein PilO
MDTTTPNIQVPLEQPATFFTANVIFMALLMVLAVLALAYLKMRKPALESDESNTEEKECSDSDDVCHR